MGETENSLTWTSIDISFSISIHIHYSIRFEVFTENQESSWCQLFVAIGGTIVCLHTDGCLWGQSWYHDTALSLVCVFRHFEGNHTIPSVLRWFLSVLLTTDIIFQVLLICCRHIFLRHNFVKAHVDRNTNPVTSHLASLEIYIENFVVWQAANKGNPLYQEHRL